VRPTTSYLILATPRSGSYLLCEALINTHLAGHPTEYFGPAQTRALLSQWKMPNYESYVARIKAEGTTPNGVFGAKVIWQFMEDVVERLRDTAGYEKLPVPQLLSTVFPDLHYIWTTRRDKVRQAVSYWKALQTDAWLGVGDRESLTSARQNEFSLDAGTRSQNQRSPTKELTFDFKAIERLRRGVEQDEAEIEQYLTTCGVQSFKVVYEDLVQTYEETALQILAYLQIPVPEKLVFGERILKKQADELSEEWVQRYYQLKQNANVEGTSLIGGR
jgi:LPS sulfotransferase NodH